MRKFGFLVGFGAGYVLGAKAGTQRYEQIKRLYDNLLSSPTVREAKGRAKDAASQGFEQAKDMASEGVSKVKEAKDRRGDSGGLSVAPPPT